MPRYEVAVATRNPKVRYLVVDLLKRLGIGFVLCSPDDKQCDMAQVVVTTDTEASQFQASRIVVVDEEPHDEDTTAIAVMLGLFDISSPTVISVGIDPGMKYGLALVADGVTIYTTTASTPRSAADYTLHWISIIQQHFQNSVLVRVGTGSRMYSALYLRSIKDSTRRIQIEMVDERHTTKRGESDKSSAALISSRNGRPVEEEDLILEAKTGYIRSLKRLVTKVTDGRLSLTSSQAKSVLQGEMTLEEILDKMVQ